MTKLRVLILLSTVVIVGIAGYFISFIARGYQFDTKTFKFLANGILVAKSDPDGASIYIDGNLRGATNSNIRLNPGSYDVQIKRDGFLPWNKRITIKKEEVAQVTAQLFKVAPSLSPVTLDGAGSPVTSSDFTKIAYSNKNGLWVMNVSSLPIGFPNEPKKITDQITTDSIYYFSPDGRQIMLENSLGSYLLDTNSFTPQNQRVNVINRKEEILKEWQTTKSKLTASQIRFVPPEMQDILQRRSKSFTFSPDETMVMYQASSEGQLKENLIPHLPGSSTQKEERNIKAGKTYIYDAKEDRNYLIDEGGSNLYWLPTSRHLIQSVEGKVVIMDYDGTNRQTVFSGSYIAPHAYPYVDANKLLILTNFGSDSTLPNLYSLSIK